MFMHHPPAQRLDTDLQLEGAPTKAEVVRAMRGHVLAEAVLVGAYRR
jgi:phosphatidylethanolamine-binding protein (PEBP) family uncharacterized protein